jgi:hypothetical protein
MGVYFRCFLHDFVFLYLDIWRLSVSREERSFMSAVELAYGVLHRRFLGMLKDDIPGWSFLPCRYEVVNLDELQLQIKMLH